MAHGSARPDARPTMVSTTWSAPPDSASSLAKIAPSAISTPTLATVVPIPVVNDVMTSLRFSPAIAPTVSPPMIRARNGLSLTTVISTTSTAIPTSVAVISCHPGAAG